MMVGGGMFWMMMVVVVMFMTWNFLRDFLQLLFSLFLQYIILLHSFSDTASPLSSCL